MKNIKEKKKKIACIQCPLLWPKGAKEEIVESEVQRFI